MKIISIITLFFCLAFYSHSSSLKDLKGIKYYSQVFKNIHRIVEIPIEDPISKPPINLKIIKVFNSKSKVIGFVREVVTTTGCDSACLPVIFTLYYSAQKKLITLKSTEGLTKKNHLPFTQKDITNLLILLSQRHQDLDKIQNPKSMVDALSGATLKAYQGRVVHEAAYSSLRIYKYHQQTLPFLNRLAK